MENRTKITQQEKQLLLQDLCARLPYYTMVLMGDGAIEPLINVNIDTYICNGLKGLPKPYLRPMSSMTEEEKKYCKEYFRSIEGQLIGMQGRTIWLIDWLNKNHFDYRDLISMGLAIEVTKENNPYK